MATSDSFCELIATVPTGLEGGAADEFRETVSGKVETSRGRINFQISSLEQLKQVSCCHHTFCVFDDHYTFS